MNNFSKKRICFFTENHYKGGLDTFFANLVNTWPCLSDELTLICNKSHPGLDTIESKVTRPISIKKYKHIHPNKIEWDRSKVTSIQSLLLHKFIGITYKALQYPILFPWYIFSLAILFRQSKFDRLMVINGGYPASLLCRSAVIAWRLAGKSSLAIMNIHSSASISPAYLKLFEYVVDILVIKCAGQFIAVSRACLDTLKNRRAFQECEKVSYIYNGIKDPIPLLELSPTNCTIQPVVKQYCLMLATYHSYKGHSFLLKAFQEVLKNYPDIYLDIYGHGFPHEKQSVINEVKRLNLESRVSLNDFSSNPLALISKAKVLVVPSQAYEAFGLTIIEAMALSIPVVVTDVGGIPEVLSGSGAGYVCSKDNQHEFSCAIQKILGNSTLATELGRNGRLTYENRFTADAMSLSYRRLLE